MRLLHGKDIRLLLRDEANNISLARKSSDTMMNGDSIFQQRYRDAPLIQPMCGTEYG
jgi:hypothetical protein